MKLYRNEKITLSLGSNEKYVVKNANQDTVLNGFTDYFIYFKNVNFMSNGVIEGRYLGEASDTLIDGYARTVSFKNGVWTNEDGDVVKTAKMVTVDSNTGATIIIQ